MGDLMSRNQDPAARQPTVDELRATLGAAVRRARVRQQIEQSDLAARAGVARGAVSRIENGQGGTINTLVGVVRALGRDDWLAALSPEVTVSPMDMIRRSKAPPQRVRRSRTEGEGT
jgi:transcriptional regulator with XRE-family HTH domain